MMPTVLTRPDIKPVRGLHLRVGESVRGVAFPKCNVAVGMTVLGYYPLVPGQPEHDYCRGTVVGNPAGSDIIVDFPEQVRSLLLNPADPRGSADCLLTRAVVCWQNAPMWPGRSFPAGMNCAVSYPDGAFYILRSSSSSAPAVVR